MTHKPNEYGDAGRLLGLGIFQALAGKASLFSSVPLHACCVGEEKSPFLPRFLSQNIYIMGKSRLLLDQWLLYKDNSCLILR